jgi:cytoskeleton protein RodZ
MAQKQPIPEIRAAAFVAAREKCALSVEELAHLACLSKKQIQQIENGQSSTFYSPTVKFTAAKKVAQLIQLDEKAAFDFGPQAELPLAQAAEPETSTPTSNPALDLNSDQKKDANSAIAKEVTKQAVEKEVQKPSTKQRKSKAVVASDGIQPEVNTPALAVLPEPVPESAPEIAPKTAPRKSTQSAPANPKPSGTKWLWLLPAGAVALLLVQFQPLLQDQLDVVMGKNQLPEMAAAPMAAPAESAAPSAPPSEAQAAPAVVAPPPVATASLPVTSANSGCPPADAVVESFKPPYANKPGNMVYVKSNVAQLMCVEDGDGKLQTKNVEAGTGYSFYGKPPFKLFTSGLSSAEVFFQGLRVRPSNAESKTILLVQVD